MKFCHISDTHIKMLKHHSEYREIFNQLYEYLQLENVDYIIHTGDLFHNKTQLSPEAVALAAEFLKKLSDIAPVFQIAGNHDGLLKNLDRQDAITPIIQALNTPRVKFLKNSGEVDLSENITLNVLSIFDRDNWVKPSDPTRINIALYHGAIAGSKTDQGWSLKDTDDDLSIFEDHDYGFLGDIHKQQFLNRNGTVAYAGSTVQQNFGETIDKGILIWDIKSKDQFTVKPVYFKNPHPFVTIEYVEGQEYNIPEDAYLRVMLNKYYSRDQIQEIQDKLAIGLSPKSIVIVDKKSSDVEKTSEISSIKKINLRDENVQQQLIKEFLSPDGLSEDVINSVLELNSKYNLSEEGADDIARNIKWSLDSFQWDNLFNYKEGNKIDFTDLSGVVGIFGKNYSGKSSIIDGLLYTLFNTTSKKIKKNFDIINERKDSGKGFASIGLDDGFFLVSRDTEKNVKKSKGKMVEEGKTNVNFEFVTSSGNFLPLNGMDRIETDKNIRKEIGTAEDFCNTSLSTQHGSLDFINEGSTKRKEILANFLDLLIFERKYKPANTDANELKTLIKKLQLKDYGSLLEECLESKVLAEADLVARTNANLELNKELNIIKEKRSKLLEDLSKVQITIDYQSLVAKKEQNLLSIEEISNKISTSTDRIVELVDFMEKSSEIINRLDFEELKKKQTASQVFLKQLDMLTSGEIIKTQKLSIHKTNSLNLESAACGTSQFNECVFKKSAIESLEEINIIEMALKKIGEDKLLAEQELKVLGYEKVNEYIIKYHKLKDKYDQSINEKLTLELKIANLKAKLLEKEAALETNDKFINLYLSNKDLYDNINLLQEKKIDLDKEVIILEARVANSDMDKIQGIKNVAAIEQKIKSYEETILELDTLNKQYSSYELYLKCMHNNGIPFDMIKNSLPILNEEMNKMLSNIVDFGASFENEDGKLEIYVTHPGKQARAIENCSGAEKSLVAMAIRLALIKCGSLPVSDVFILDEPATALDSEHLESFVKVLDMIKSEFKIVLLITHLDALKDSVDKIIEIQKDEDGYAFIN